MCPPVASPISDISPEFTVEEIFMRLFEMISGVPLPANVISDVNPYKYAPSNLPNGIWYLIHSKENEGTTLGFWKVKGEACKLFSNHGITGWRSTLEFYEGQLPHEHKTDWVMQEYWITQKEVAENSKRKEATSLCRVFLAGKEGSDHKKQKAVAGLSKDRETYIPSTQLIIPKVLDETGSGSTSKHEVDNDDETGLLPVTGERPGHLLENPLENDYFSGGDFLELRDLIPRTPSSSSDNSSCLTMSSGECFDSLTLLHDLEPESNQELVQKDDVCKLNVFASARPSEVVMLAASPGPIISIEGSKAPTNESPSTESYIPGLARYGKEVDGKALEGAGRYQKGSSKDEGPSHYSQDSSSSSGSQTASEDGKKKASKDRRKKLKKYMCFLPLHFFF